MKFLIQFAFTVVLILIFQVLLGLPWWSATLAALFAALPDKGHWGRTLGAGFSAGFLIWLIAAFVIDSQNGGILSAQMIQLLFKSENAFLLVLATGMIGGIAGGLGALCGTGIRRAF